MAKQQRVSFAKEKMSSIINFEELYYEEKEQRMRVERELELQRIKVKKLLSSHPRLKYCPECQGQDSLRKSGYSRGFKDDGIIEDLKDFSVKMSSIKFQEPTAAEDSVKKKQKKHIAMIENFAIFGIEDATIKANGREANYAEEFEGQMLYSKNEASHAEMHGAKIVFPSGMAMKRISGMKAKEKTIELMSFCYTNLKSFVLSFEPPKEKDNPQCYHKNEVLEHLNPQRRLFCLCIGIHDYTWIEKTQSRYNVSLGEIPGTGSWKAIDPEQQTGIGSEGRAEQLNLQEAVNTERKEEELQIAITQRVFCITSYFPFFTFYEELLRNLANNIKMERLAIYKHNEENIEVTMRQTDSRFQLERMKELFNECSADVLCRRVQFNRSFEVKLINQQKISLMTDWNLAKSYFVEEWVFAVLHMFNYDTFMDLLTLVLLEDRIVIVCENSHILTYTIYLFASILPRPFIYALPVVNIIPNQEEYFNAPFPVLYGLLKKRKYVEEKRIVENYDNTYVFLSPERVQILYSEDRKELLKRRTNKLGILKEHFKELKKFRRKESRIAKYEVENTEYNIMASTDEKQASVQIIIKINEYMHQEIAKKLPSQVQIEQIRRKIDMKAMQYDKDQNSYMMALISQEIRKNNKDHFLDKIVDTQMVNNYLFH